MTTKLMITYLIQIIFFISLSLVDAGTIWDDAPIQLKQFTPNVTHRTNLCDRQQMLRLGDIEFLDVLRGLKLSVGLPYLQTAMGYVVYDEERSSFNSDYPGYWIEVLDELAYRAGFSWRDSYGIILPFYHEHGYRPYTNTTINDLLLWTVNAYDFSFSEWDRSIDRMKLGIDFPTGFRDSSTILIALTTDDDEANFQIFSFLQPFDWSVWLSIVITIIFTGLVYRLSSHIYKIEQSTTQERDRHKTEHLPGVTIFYSALAATGHSEFKPSTYPERILVISLCFWSLVISATYTANLASVMISKREPVYLATSLVEAQYKGVPVCAGEVSHIADKLRNAYPEINLVLSEGVTNAYHDLRAGKCGLVADTVERFEINKLNHTINPDCKLQWVGRAVDMSSAGPAVLVDAGHYCTSLIGSVFDYYLKEMIRDGFVEKAFDRYAASVATQHTCPEDEIPSDVDDSFRLTMMDMGGVFLIHGVACVLGLILSCMQQQQRNMVQRNMGKRATSRVEVQEQNNEAKAHKIDIIGGDEKARLSAEKRGLGIRSVSNMT